MVTGWRLGGGGSGSGLPVERHLSVLHALQAFGHAEADARALIRATRRQGAMAYAVERDGKRYVIRKMKGGHADVFEQ